MEKNDGMISYCKTVIKRRTIKKWQLNTCGNFVNLRKFICGATS